MREHPGRRPLIVGGDCSLLLGVFAHVRGVRAAAVGGSQPMWLHADVDVLDPGVLPAVTYRQGGGPDFAQLAALLEPLVVSPRLVGVSVADFRPDLDPDGVHARRLVGLIENCITHL
ncbi:arginase family protein [Actinoplanes bogorensis]|uniref:Arginase family protein n=2 Tax=Paractinoplanes bogorensis TaxID=1610840 RepID=A0ABS5Z622_9ACTN|nr:arginase family protein [Actinoplanes bogorensis]